MWRDCCNPAFVKAINNTQTQTIQAGAKLKRLSNAEVQASFAETQAS
jgi:hypothetical protein